MFKFKNKPPKSAAFSYFWLKIAGSTIRWSVWGRTWQKLLLSPSLNLKIVKKQKIQISTTFGESIPMSPLRPKQTIHLSRKRNLKSTSILCKMNNPLHKIPRISNLIHDWSRWRYWDNNGRHLKRRNLKLCRSSNLINSSLLSLALTATSVGLKATSLAQRKGQWSSSKNRILLRHGYTRRRVLYD